MKKILYTIFLAFLVFVSLGASCQERFVDLPVTGVIEQTFNVNSNTFSFEEEDMVNFNEEIQRLRDENTFDSVKSVTVESVSFTIVDNNSGAGAEITGSAWVSSVSYNSLLMLASLTDLNLGTVENVEQFPDLTNEGVAQINTAIDLDNTNHEIYFRVTGNVDPDVSLDFKILVKVTITIVGQIKTEVPVI